MKKIITILLLTAAIGAKAQTQRIKSYLGDSIKLVNPYCRQFTPIIVTMNGDTARSIIWSVGPISRDSTAGTVITVTLFDKNANVLINKNLPIMESAYTKWSGLFTAIDNYIHNQISRVTLH